ncbi:hypothetical protein MKW98_007088 [Papaver atlanticum]|uniref:DRBM domain-containing protein n=1 Tax=Papaver atlanticum TaxID=357466 RepID=A0AAD4SWF2_9MAGN|nr:hypothetical protein MKW98_007088 [Papaver atlanticum]
MEQNQSSSSGKSSGLPDYRNCLITYAQQSAVALPVYEIVNEGFRCTVYLEGEAYRSANTFGNPEDAEQDASKLALESIAKKIKEENIAIIDKDSLCCKSILSEYAAKMKLPFPTYTTTRIELLDFISSLVFDGKTYIGHLARNKKDAEKLAAREVIISILGTSDSGTYLSEIIRSKSRLSNASHEVEVPQTVQDTYMTTVASPRSNGGGSTRKRKQILNPSPPTLWDTVRCKSILNDYAVKMNLSKPIYTTIQQERVPFFVSLVVFHGKTYTGLPASNKKDAERLAAHKAIHSIGIACA